jgi:hypothetical protein
MKDDYLMEVLDLLLVTAFTPVVCLIFLIFMDVCAAHAKRRRYMALEKYQPGLFATQGAVHTYEKLVSGSHHAKF